MSKLEKLKEKFPTAKYEPVEDCQKCGGKGEVWFAGNDTFLPAWKPCACIFIEPDFLPVFREAMSETIRKIRDGIE